MKYLAIIPLIIMSSFMVLHHFYIVPIMNASEEAEEAEEPTEDEVFWDDPSSTPTPRRGFLTICRSNSFAFRLRSSLRASKRISSTSS